MTLLHLNIHKHWRFPYVFIRGAIGLSRHLTHTHHGSGVFPLGQLVEDPQQVDTGEKVPPAELVVVSCFLKNKNKQNKRNSAESERRRDASWSSSGAFCHSPSSRPWAQASHGPHSGESPARICCDTSHVFTHVTKRSATFLILYVSWRFLPVFGTDVGHDVLVEELEDERDAVGEHQMLGDYFELREKEMLKDRK